MPSKPGLPWHTAEGEQHYLNQATAVCQISLKCDLSALEHCNHNHSLGPMGASASWSTRWTKLRQNILENTSLYTRPDVTADHNMVLCCDTKVLLLVPNCLPRLLSLGQISTKSSQECGDEYPYLISIYLTFLRLFRLLKSCCQYCTNIQFATEFQQFRDHKESLKIIDQSKNSDVWSTVSQVLTYLLALLWQAVHLY